jgi:hypothetical protein
MPVRIDQARQERLALAVDDARCSAGLRPERPDSLNLSIIADQDRGEALDPSIGPDLDTVNVVDEGARPCG